MKQLFAFLASPNFSQDNLPEGVTLDASRIAVAGASGGGYPAYIAGLYASPKPKAICVHFGTGGQLLSDFKLFVKDRPMPFPGADLITDENMAHFFNKPLSPVSEATLEFTQDTVTDQNNRLRLFPAFWRQGTMLDYILGRHGISASLRNLPLAERMNAIPPELHAAIPQSQFSKDYPPTFLIHGALDDVVLLKESQTTYDRLRELGVKVELRVVEGAAHELIDPNNMPSDAPGAAEVREEGVRFMERELS